MTFWSNTSSNTDSAPVPPDLTPLTVSQLTRQVKILLEEYYPHVWVEGELSTVRQPQSGHIYFLLKDENSQLRGVMFRSAARTLKFRPEDGQQVVVSGHITVYEARGEYQLIVSYLEPKGKGALQVAFEQLKKKLASEALFAVEHKQALPRFPHKIGIVTSPTGAAIHDILHITRRRFSNVHIVIYPSKVQGTAAAPEIVEGIRTLDGRNDIDVIIVGRGGGSLEDLWPFNEECVARAIFAAKTPIISAVGHETDFTIADFVADVRAPTPSAAAELVVKNKVELQQQLLSFSSQLKARFTEQIERNETVLRSLMSRPIYTDPQRYFQERKFLHDDLQTRLVSEMSKKLEGAKHETVLRQHGLFALSPLGQLEQMRHANQILRKQLLHTMHVQLEGLDSSFHRVVKQLHVLSPLAHLKRGYTIVLSEDQTRIVKSTKQLRKDDRIWVRFSDGRTLCGIENIVKDGPGSVHHD